MDLCKESLLEVEWSDEVNAVAKQFQVSLLFSHDLLWGHGSMGDLLGDNLGVEWEDILELGSKVHGDDTD